MALTTEGVDFAFRFGFLGDLTATAHRPARIERVLVATPAYLGRAGRSVRPESRLMESANEGAVAAAVAGLGIATTGSRAKRDGKRRTRARHA